MEGRINILLSIPADFIEKFNHFVNNINAINSDKEQQTVRIETVYCSKKEESEIENKIKK